MADIKPVTPEMEAAWNEWLDTRTAAIRPIAARFRPWKLYRMNSTGHRVVVISFNPQGTMTVEVNGDWNFVAFERQVFGVDPDDLEECDLPGPDERLGSLDMTPDEAQAALEALEQRGSIDQN